MMAPRRVQHSLDLLVVVRSKSCNDVSRWQRNMQGSLYVLTSPLETKAMCKSRKEGKQKGYLISFFRPLKFPVFASSLAEWEVQCWLPYKNRVLFCKLQFFKYYPPKSIKCLEVTESKAGRGRDRGGSFSVFCFGNQRMEGVWPYPQQQIDDVIYFTLFIIRFRVLRVNYFEWVL